MCRCDISMVMSFGMLYIKTCITLFSVSGVFFLVLALIYILLIVYLSYLPSVELGDFKYWYPYCCHCPLEVLLPEIQHRTLSNNHGRTFDSMDYPWVAEEEVVEEGMLLLLLLLLVTKSLLLL